MLSISSYPCYWINLDKFEYIYLILHHQNLYKLCYNYNIYFIIFYIILCNCAICKSYFVIIYFINSLYYLFYSANLIDLY